MLHRKMQRAKARRDRETNARPNQSILCVEAESERGQVGKTEAEWPADTGNRGRRKEGGDALEVNPREDRK
jgi:hypothetical protein